MSIKTMSDNACYAGRSTSVPLVLNTPRNRISINLYARSDVNTLDISLYEKNGKYWYSFALSKAIKINSVCFVSLQNCVASLRDIVRVLGFTLDDSDRLSRFVRSWNRQGREVA